MSNEMKNRFSPFSIFNNNKFVLIFSLVASFCLWLWISIEKSPVIEHTVLSVPVQINLEDSIPSQLGLQVFGNENYTVDVTVVGKKFVVGSITADDIRVTAQTSYVDSAGTKNLILKANVLNGKDFEITALSQNSISVFFDSPKETELQIEPKIISNTDKIVADGLVLGDAVFSSSTITVSGPATEVNKITGVVAECVIDETLSKTTTVTPELKLIGASANELKYAKITNESSVVTMTLPVMKSVLLPVNVTLRNAPADYLDNSYEKTISPSSAKVLVQVEKLDQIKEIVVGTVDFSKLSEGRNTFRFKADDISDYIFESKNIKFEYSITIDDVVSKTMSVPTSKFKIENQKSGFSVKITDSELINIKVIGKAADIENLTAENINAVVDLSNIEMIQGSMRVPVTFSVNYSTSCWVSGEYKITIACEKNENGDVKSE